MDPEIKRKMGRPPINPKDVKKHRISVNFTEELYFEAAKMAAETNRSISFVVAVCVEHVLIGDKEGK